MHLRNILSASAWCLSGICLFVVLAVPLVLTSAPKTDAQVPVSDLPEDLALVPKDALAFVHMRVADLWTSPTLQFVQRQLDPKLFEAASLHLEKRFGLTLAEIDRITLVVLAQQPPQWPEPYFIVQTLKPINRERLLSVLLPGALQDSALGMHYLQDRPGPAVRFLSDRLMVIGSQEGIRLHSAKLVRAEGPLAVAVKEAADKHHLVAGLHLSSDTSARLRGLFLGEQPNRKPDLMSTALGWLFDVQHGMVVMDLGYTTTCRTEFVFGGEWQAKRAFRTSHGVIVMLQALAAMGQLQMRQSQHMVQMLSAYEQSLDSAVVEVQGTTVRTSVVTKFTPASFDQAMLELFQSYGVVGGQVAGGAGTENLKLLGIAMHNYHNDFQALPCHAIYSGDGKPLLSWRVSLLPYLGQDALYRQFKLDEPWNSVHNRKLLEQMPPVFTLAGAAAPSGYTYYQVVVTPRDQRGAYKTIFPLVAGGQMTLGRISAADGAANTIMILEANKSVPWTAPEDVVMPPDDRPLPRFGADPKFGWFTACFADGSVRVLRNNIPDDSYQRLMRQLLGVVDSMTGDVSAILEPAEFRLQRGVIAPGTGAGADPGVGGAPVIPSGGIDPTIVPGGVPAGGIAPGGTAPGGLRPTGTGRTFQPDGSGRPMVPQNSGRLPPFKPQGTARPTQPLPPPPRNR